MEKRAPSKPSGLYGPSDRLGPRLFARAKTKSSVHTEKGEEERRRAMETKEHRQERRGKGRGRARRGREERKSGKERRGPYIAIARRA